MHQRVLLSITIAVVYLLHQDVWFWRAARPLVFGILPVGLAYHAAYCLGAVVLMWVVTAIAWPADLDVDARSGAGDGRAGARRTPPFTR
jgi:hypothetical protein